MKVNFFKKLLRSPKYLSMQAAGIDVCNECVRYIEFGGAGEKTFIKNFGEIPLAPNTFKDGDIIDADALSKALAEAKKKISSDFVKLSIPDEKTYLFDTWIPLVKGSDVRESIEFNLEENVPLKRDEVFFEYDVIEKEERDGIKGIFVSVSVIPKKNIQDFTDVCVRAGLAVESFEMESRVTAHAVVQNGDSKTFLVVDIKEGSTLLSLVVSGIVRFTSTVALGDAAIKENISTINPSVPAGKIPDSFLNANADIESKLSYSLVNVFSVIVDEMKKFDDYLLSKSEEKSTHLPKMIDEIILSGRSAALPSFAAHIRQNMNAKVVLANVWSNSFDINEKIPRIAFNDSLDFASAIGLAIL